MRAWYRRWRILIGEAWRFAIVGGTNVVINFIVFNALVVLLFAGSELKANVVATIVATTTSYLMNRGWTFRHRRTSRIPLEYVLFFVFNGIALAIELGVMGAAKYGLGLTSLWALNLAKATGLGIGTVFRFFTYRTFVFAGGTAAATATDPGSAGPTGDHVTGVPGGSPVTSVPRSAPGPRAEPAPSAAPPTRPPATRPAGGRPAVVRAGQQRR